MRSPAVGSGARRFSRCSLGVALVGLAACGSGDKPAASQSLAAVRSCLADAHLQARGGPHRTTAGDRDAPDGELVLDDATFIAFYDDPARAERLGPTLQSRAETLGGTTTRHGRITVLYTGAAGSGRPDPRVERCVGARTADAHAQAGRTGAIDMGGRSAECRRLLHALEQRLHTHGEPGDFNAGCASAADPVTGQNGVVACPKKLPPNTACDVDYLDQPEAGRQP